MEVYYDRAVDIVGVCYSEGQPSRTVFVDEFRTVEYSDAGMVMGVEFASASEGVRLIGLPVNAPALTRRLQEEGLRVLDNATVTGDIDLEPNVSSSSALVASLARTP